MIDKDHIIANLREVFDPEISINVYDLGLIYNVETCTAEYSVDITHTLTSAFCPFADEIISNIRQAGLVDNVRIVNVITTFEPPFTVDSVPEETRATMGW